LSEAGCPPGRSSRELGISVALHHDRRRRRPIFAKKKLLDSVCVMEVVEREVTEHHED
jgi:hypothetical protein